MVSFSSVSRLVSLISLVLLFTSYVASLPSGLEDISQANRFRPDPRLRDPRRRGRPAGMGSSSSHEAAAITPVFHAYQSSAAGQYASPQQPNQMYDFLAGKGSSLHHQQLMSSSGPSTSMPSHAYMPMETLGWNSSERELENYMSLYDMDQRRNALAVQNIQGELKRTMRQRQQNLEALALAAGHGGAPSSHSHFPIQKTSSMVPPEGNSIIQYGGDSGSSGKIPQFSYSGLGLDPSDPIDLDSDEDHDHQPDSSQAGPSQVREGSSQRTQPMLTKYRTIREVLPSSRPLWASQIRFRRDVAKVYETVTMFWPPKESLIDKVRKLVYLDKYLLAKNGVVPHLLKGDQTFGQDVAEKINSIVEGQSDSSRLSEIKQALEGDEHPTILNRIYYYVLREMKDPTFEEQSISLELVDHSLKVFNRAANTDAWTKLQNFDKSQLDIIVDEIRNFKKERDSDRQGTHHG